MLTWLNILYCLGCFLVLWVIHLFHRFMIKPYLLLQFYKKQGVETKYFSLVREMNQFEGDLINHGDCFYSMKQRAHENPKPRVWATGFKDEVVVRLKDPQLIKDFLLNQDRYYRKLPNAIVFLRELSEKGLLFSEGADWKKHRKLASAAFNYEFLKEMIPEIISIANEFLERLKQKDLSKVDISLEMQLITGEVVGRIFFGENFSDYKIEGQPLAQYLTELLITASLGNAEILTLFLGENLIKKGITPAHKRLLKRIRDFKAVMKDMAIQKMTEISNEQKQPNVTSGKNKRVNLIELFYNQRAQTPDEAFSDEEIIDEFITFFSAGMETTAHLIRMATYYYLVNPSYQNKVLEEVNSFFKDPTKLTIETLNKMDYMTAWMKESLRMTPIGGYMFPREAIMDHKLGWLEIKKGTILNVPFLSNYFDPDYYQKPDEFMPERWLDENSKTKRNVNENPFIYTPFSAGPRNCIGQHLAINEARIIFGLFLKKFEYSLVDKDYKMVLIERAVYEPLEPLIYKLKVKE